MNHPRFNARRFLSGANTAIGQISQAGNNISNRLAGLGDRQADARSAKANDFINGLRTEEQYQAAVDSGQLTSEGLTSAFGGRLNKDVFSNAEGQQKENRADFLATTAFNDKKRQINELPIQQQISALKAEAERTNDYTAFNAALADGGIGANLSNKSTLLSQGTQSQRDTAKFFRGETNRIQKEQSDSAVTSLISNSSPTLTSKSAKLLDSTIQDSVSKLNKQFGSEVNVTTGDDGRLNFSGDIDNNAFHIAIANGEGTPEQKAATLREYVNDPTRYFKDKLNSSIDGLSLDTERNTNKLKEDFLASDLARNLSPEERASALDNLSAGVADAFGLQGTEVSDFETLSTGIKDTEAFDLNALQTTVSNLQSTIETPLSLSNPKNRVQAVKNSTEFIKNASDNFDGTFRLGTYGGQSLVKKVTGIINNGFTYGGKVIKREDLSDAMVMSALTALHESDNSVFNEGIDLDDLKNLLATYANDANAFNSTQLTKLNAASSELDNSVRTSNTRVSANIEAAKAGITGKRNARIKAAQDAKNLKKFLTGN